MLSKLKNLYRGNVLPIGIDLGSHTLKIAQVRVQDDKPELVAAASLAVPQELRRDPGALVQWFEQAVRDLVARGGFQGRQAVLSLPASWMHVTRLRLAEGDDAAIRQALTWETVDKLPIHPSQAMIRHFVAGRVYQGSEQRNEVVVIACKQALMNQFIEAAARAKLDVMGMCAEPVATIGLFGTLFETKGTVAPTWALIDIGRGGSRIYIIRQSQLLFARTVPLGGDQFNATVAKHMEINEEQARELRRRLPDYLSASPAAPATETTTGALIRRENEKPAEGPLDRSRDIQDEQLRKVDRAQGPLIQRFIDEIRLCRQYFESTFPDQSIRRIAFLGGESMHRRLCQQIAAELNLPAAIVDPAGRIKPAGEMAEPIGLDLAQPQPALAVAMGLSLSGRQGPVAGSAAA